MNKDFEIAVTLDTGEANEKLDALTAKAQALADLFTSIAEQADRAAKIMPPSAVEAVTAIRHGCPPTKNFMRSISEMLRISMQDLSKLSDAYEKATTEQEQFEATDLGLFENVAYIMAKHADKDAVPSSVEEWLDSFEVFSIYQVLPEILTLWNLNTLTTAKPKKKQG